MKNIFTLLIFIGFNSFNSIGQTVNQLTAAEFESISINGVVIEEIIKSNGNLDRLPEELGKPIKTDSYRGEKAPKMTSVDYDGLHIGFSDQLKAKGNLTRIEFSDSKNIINILGYDFYLGKDISEAIKKFDVNSKPNGGQGLLFSPKYDSTVFLSISFDSNGVVTKIIYYVLT